jgi:N utilization substance protein A
MSEQIMELLPVLEQIEREKGIKKDDLIKMVQTALISAFRKHSGNKDLELDVTLDEITGKVKAYHIRKVVEAVTNQDREISLEEALILKPKAKVGMDLKFEINTDEFGRIAAQTAKQVIIQKIREIEKENIYNELLTKVGKVLTGSINKFAGRNIILDMGRGEAILPVREQCPREKFNMFDRIKVYVIKVERMPRGPQMVVSRIHPELVKSLFKLEVPEVYDGTVEIKDVVREPGSRIKVAVISHNPKVDPIGSCVGVKGVRIKSVIKELQGARIDMVAFSNEPTQYIVNALNPAKVLSIETNKETKKANVTVADDQLSIAIGQAGQNVRLAVKLTGWDIEIKSESAKKAEKQAQTDQKMSDFTGLEGVGEKTADILIKSGYKTVESLANSSVDALTAFQGIGEKTAQKIINSAKSAMAAGTGAKTEVSDDDGKETEKDNKENS